MDSFLKKNINKGLFFSIREAKEISTPFFIKGDFIRYHYFINISIFYRNRSLMLVKTLFLDFSTTAFYNYFFFLICFQDFYIFFKFIVFNYSYLNLQLQNCSWYYNVPLVSVKSALFIKFIASFLLIKLITPR